MMDLSIGMKTDRRGFFRVVFFLVVAIGSLSSARAQIEVELSMTGDQFVIGEPVFAMVEVTNNAGKPVTIGNFPGWMDVTVESKGGGVTPRLGSLSATDGVEIQSGRSFKIPFEVTDLYVLNKRARYEIKTSLRIVGWESAFSSNEIHFDLVEGKLLWSMDYSSPMLVDENGSQEVHSYSLISCAGKDGRRLVVQIKDTDYGKVVRSVPVCRMVSFSKPEARIDQRSNLHLLCQYGRSYFTYNVYNPKGDLMVRLTYQAAPARPSLGTNEEGLIIVEGGFRVPMDTDYLPEPDTASADPRR